MNKRETQLDILRLIAMSAVIFIHACGIGADFASAESILTFLTATVTWHVPVFVMISGRFFLDPDRALPVARLRKAIVRLVIAFLFWNLFYQAYYLLTGAYGGLNWKGVLSEALVGPYHFWYLFMLVCLYAVVPFLRKITESKKLMEYFIALFLVFGFLTAYGPELPLVGDTLSRILENTHFHLALGFSGYYILGYYLHRYPLSGRKEIGLYALGIGMLLFTGLATVLRVRREGITGEWFSKYLMPNVAMEAAAIYTFFTNRVSRIRFRKKTAVVISKLAEYSFGVYLIHGLVIELLTYMGFGKLPVPVLLRILLTQVISCAVCIAATALIRKIPRIGKIIA